MTYAPQHSRALSTVARKGAAVSFTVTSPGTYDAPTDTYSSASTSSVAGYAVRIAGSPERHRALELIESAAPTLLFTPTTYGQVPAIGSSVTWNSESYVVRDVFPLAPDGNAILSEVVIVK